MEPECARCEEKPLRVPDLDEPVCGCDGNTYQNSYAAAKEGVSINYEGECGKEVPALSPIGLIALVGSLGLAALAMIRRR